ncbi:MAG: enoyl-CoA hydratase-related protein, partial [Myxococcota bacterium]
MTTPVPQRSPDPLVTTSYTDHVLTLTLNRPARLNPLSEEMLVALQEALDAAATTPEVRVVILAAAGKAFCAGHDLREMRGISEQEAHQELFDRCGRMMQTVTAMPKPVIAQVQGLATAAGCQLVAACDLAVASTQARFAVSGINVGLFCS